MPRLRTKGKSLTENQVVSQKNVNDLPVKIEDKLSNFSLKLKDKLSTFSNSVLQRQTCEFEIPLQYSLFARQIIHIVQTEISLWAIQNEIVITKLVRGISGKNVWVRIYWKYFVLKYLTLVGLSDQQDQNVWTKFLTRELYDPRLLGMIRAFQIEYSEKN